MNAPAKPANNRAKLAHAGQFNHDAPQNGNRKALARLLRRQKDYDGIVSKISYHKPGSMKK
jgi:hypothetical protein